MEQQAEQLRRLVGSFTLDAKDVARAVPAAGTGRARLALA
jgi:hypothetical protein